MGIGSNRISEEFLHFFCMFLMKGYKDCERFCTVLPGAKYLADAVKVDSVLWWGVISACNQ